MAANEPTIDDLSEGMEATHEVVFDDACVECFIRLTGDDAAVHVELAAAHRMGFPDRIVHGLLVAAPFSRLLGKFLPGPRTVIQSIELDFRRPVPRGSTVVYRVRLRRLVPAVRTAVLDLAAEVDGVLAAGGTAKCTFRDVDGTVSP